MHVRFYFRELCATSTSKNQTGPEARRPPKQASRPGHRPDPLDVRRPRSEPASASRAAQQPRAQGQPATPTAARSRARLDPACHAGGGAPGPACHTGAAQAPSCRLASRRQGARPGSGAFRFGAAPWLVGRVTDCGWSVTSQAGRRAGACGSGAVGCGAGGRDLLLGGWAVSCFV